MRLTRNAHRLLLIPLALLLFALPIVLGGCSDDSTTPENTETAPELPDPAKLEFDLSFDDAKVAHGASPDEVAFDTASQLHFFNAGLRVIFIRGITQIMLTPPVAAFGLAWNSLPTLQEDNSWIWVYTHVYGGDELQVRLRGLKVEEGAEWQMRVSSTATDPPLDNQLWFSGTTQDAGATGDWTFHGLLMDDYPEVGQLAWGTDTAGEYLSYTVLHGVETGNTLAYHRDVPDHSIDYNDAQDVNQWFIRWNVTAGTGSLMVPNYNGGEEACWDGDQNDTDCE